MIQIQHNRIKNPNWHWGGNQLAIYKLLQPKNWTRHDREQIQQVARAGLEPWTAGFRVQPANHSATLPPLTSLFLKSQRREVSNFTLLWAGQRTHHFQINIRSGKRSFTLTNISFLHPKQIALFSGRSSTLKNPTNLHINGCKLPLGTFSGFTNL